MPGTVNEWRKFHHSGYGFRQESRRIKTEQDVEIGYNCINADSNDTFSGKGVKHEITRIPNVLHQNAP